MNSAYFGPSISTIFYKLPQCSTHRVSFKRARLWQQNTCFRIIHSRQIFSQAGFKKRRVSFVPSVDCINKEVWKAYTFVYRNHFRVPDRGLEYTSMWKDSNGLLRYIEERTLASVVDIVAFGCNCLGEIFTRCLKTMIMVVDIVAFGCNCLGKIFTRCLKTMIICLESHYRTKRISSFQ